MKSQSLGWAAWCAALLLCVLIYLPGLSGGFTLDDHNNLAGLSGIQGESLADSASYVLQGFAGPGGRPLSLLSFALQREHWPHDPAAFKRANLALHLLNATLLLLLGLALQAKRRDRTPGEQWVPWLAAGLWLLWPIHASTVLYVIQRMAMLSASCMILGLLLLTLAGQAWHVGRYKFAHGLFVMACLVGLPVGILFKESAGVFPLVALSLILLRAPATAWPRQWIVILWVLAAAIVILIGLRVDLQAGYAARPFDLSDRLMTQGRVLWMYVGQILMPNLDALKFSYDGLEVSRGWLTPWTTMCAALAWLAVLIAAVSSRARMPVGLFALCFFMGNHALESSVLPLELAFEHRNYLASFGLATLAAWLAARVLAPPQPRRQRIAFGIAAGLYLGCVTLVTYLVSNLWGDELKWAVHRYQQQPESPRARTGLAEALRDAGQHLPAAKVLEKARHDFPDDPVFPLLQAQLACVEPALAPESLDLTARLLQTGGRNAMSAFAALDRLAASVESGLCNALSLGDVLVLAESASQNPAMERYAENLMLIRGRLHVRLGRVAEARQLLQRAVIAEPDRPNLLVQAAAWELGQGNLAEASRYIEMLGPTGALSFRQRLAIAKDRERLQKWLEAQGQQVRENPAVSSPIVPNEERATHGAQ